MPNRPHPNRLTTSLIAAALLALHLALGLGQMRNTSPTFDEGFYIARGWAWWHTGQLQLLGHPAFASQLAGLPVLLEPGLPLPTQIDGWPDRPDTFSQALLWHHAPHPTRLIFLARLPFLLLSLVLGAFTFMWARQRFGPLAGLVALTLHALSPNLLGNAPLAATDLPVAAFYVMALWAYARALKRPGWRPVLLAGALVGLTQASKFSGLILGPTLVLFTLPHLKRWRTVLPAALGVVGVALLTLWASYGFRWSPYPLAQYIAELQHLFTLDSEGHFAYLLGQLSADGWWYYHPLVLAVKTPLVIPVLLVLSVEMALRQRDWQPADTLLFGAAGLFLGVSMLTSLNVGYRYLLPIVPLLHIYAAGATRMTQRPTLAVILSFAAFWSGATLLNVAPDYLTYFNELAGGPDNGWQVLADSNLDWGQGLPLLAKAVGDEPIYLSYFGQADPAAYGLNATMIPGWPPPEPIPDFDPAFPAAGRYAISASNLVGVQLYEPNALSYFRSKTPEAVIDHSFFIYAVPERPPGEWFNQCIDPVPLLRTWEIIELTGRGNLARADFDCSTALLLGDSPGWVLLPETLTAPVALPPPDYIWWRADGSPHYRLYYLPDGWQPELPGGAPVTFGEALTLHGASVAREGDTLTVLGLWQVEQALPPPVSIYAHLISPSGEFLSAGDALGAPAEVWQPGQRLVQQHTLQLPPGAPPGEYRIFLGLYRLDDQIRYTTVDGLDGVQVGVIVVE